MTEYHKYIDFKGNYYTRTQVKIKHHKDKIRYVQENTIIKKFKEHKAAIYVHLEDREEAIYIDSFSDRDLISRYLGEKFL